MTDKRVPREPTPGMIEVALGAGFTSLTLRGKARAIWRAMYDAAPAVPDERDGTELVHSSYVADTAREILALRRERDALKAALLNVAPRTDGDGKPCWCSDLRDGLFRGEHLPFCKHARALLAAPEDAP